MKNRGANTARLDTSEQQEEDSTERSPLPPAGGGKSVNVLTITGVVFIAFAVILSFSEPEAPPRPTYNVGIPVPDDSRVPLGFSW